MSEKQQQKTRTMNVKIGDEVRRGAYANKLMTAHSDQEFVLDFIADFPPGPEIVARVITSPGHLRSFIDALSANLARYESRFGGPGSSGSGPPRTPPADA
jgi:hypothetical protein